MGWLSRRRLVIITAAVAVAAALAVAAPEIYTGTFSDLGTFLRVVAVAAALAGWSLAVRRWVRHELAAAALIAVPVIVVLGVFVWPYVRPPTEVDEAFPPVATPVATPVAPTTAATSPPASLPAAAPTTAATSPPTSTSTSTATATPTAPDPTAAPPPTAPPSTAAPAPTAPPTTPAPTTTVPPGPVELRRGSFQGLTGHRGSGDAVVYDLGAGPRLLRFEEVDIGSGPRLEVYLVPGADRRGLGDAIHVAPLTAERGNQNYDVPGGVDLTSGTWTVLVWCETFDVEVANATLTG